jgi:protein phosphatase 1 regulatory subunit 11
LYLFKKETPILRLRCHKPKPEKRVQFSQGTVDNEHMDKKKSKCCCVYVKPKKFGESSSESDDDCEHCTGHVEKKKHKSVKHDQTNHPDLHGT